MSTKVEAAIQLYRTFSSAPRPLRGCLTLRMKNKEIFFQINLEEEDSDTKKLETRKITRSITGSLKRNGMATVLTSSVEDTTTVKSCSYTADGKKKALLRLEEKEGGIHQYIEIWNDQRRLETFDLTSVEQHGKIYHDDEFGSFQLNDDGTYLAYIAEKKYGDPEPLFKQYNSDGKNKQHSSADVMDLGEFFDDWGEGHEQQCSSVLCILDTATGSITVKASTAGADVTVGQAQWLKKSCLVFVEWNKKPFTLGILYCSNRQNRLCVYDTVGKKITFVTGESHSISSPRCTPDGQYIIYLRNPIGGPHRTASSLVKYDLAFGTTQEVVHPVAGVTGDECPGIYTDRLPERCFANDGRAVVFSSIWMSNMVIVVVDIHNGSIQKLNTGFFNGSIQVLDVTANVVLAAASSPSTKPFLVLGKLDFSMPSVQVVWSVLDNIEQIPEIDWSVDMVTPQDPLAFVGFETITVMPSQNKMKPAVIIWPHGGPHTTHVTSYNAYVAAFVSHGYTVGLVNYRGSCGFGEAGIMSLIGKIGSQDISDVEKASVFVRKRVVSQLYPGRKYEDHRIAVFLLGGSHGGFINAHLSAAHPELYRACALRNPVTDLAGMIEGTDIPDWIWAESGYDIKNPYTEVRPEELWEVSPLRTADTVKIPILILLGKKDRRVPYTQGLKYHRVLQAVGVPSRIYVYNDGHALSSTLSSADAFVRIFLFFEGYLSD